MRVWRTCFIRQLLVWFADPPANRHYVFYRYIMRTERVVTLQITATAGYRTLRLIQIARALAPHELSRRVPFLLLPPN